MNLRTRLAVTLMAAVLPLLLAIGAGLLSGVRNLPRDNVDQYLRTQAEELRDQPLGVSALRTLIGVDGEDGSDGFNEFVVPNRLQVIQASGQISTPTGRQLLPINEDDRELARGEEDDDILRSVEWNGVNYRMITFAVEGVDLNRDGLFGPRERGGVIQLARDVDDASQLVDGLIPRVAFYSAIGALVAGLFGWVTATRISGPVTALTNTAERVAKTQDLTSRIPVQRQDEVGRLATSFNTMLAALETSRKQQHQLVMDANHELRTPLTSLRTNIEVLQRNRDALTDTDRERLLSDITMELDELTLLVSELVDSATSIDQSTEPFEEVELGELVEGIAATARRRTGREVEVVTFEPELVRIRPDMVSRAVQNLLSNAHKFSPDGAPIRITVHRAVVTVLDSGPGIDPSEHDVVFDRFYRATESRSKPGSGLGLAIVKQIAESHGGTASVGDAPGGGAAVVVNLTATIVPDDASGSLDIIDEGSVLRANSDSTR